MAQRPDIQRPLRWLMIIRVVVATTLMISAFVIELIFRPEVTLQPFYIPIGLAYLLSLLYSLLFSRFKNSWKRNRENYSSLWPGKRST